MFLPTYKCMKRSFIPDYIENEFAISSQLLQYIYDY